MKTPEHNNSESIWGAISGFCASMYHNIGESIDWSSIGNTVLCTITGIIVARLIKKYFPESKK